MTLAINTLTGYVVFGLIFLIHTHLTFDAVEALVKEAMARNLFGSIYA
jgi:adenosine deaminase